VDEAADDRSGCRVGIEADNLEAVRLRGRCRAGARSHQLAVQKADPHCDRF